MMWCLVSQLQGLYLFTFLEPEDLSFRLILHSIDLMLMIHITTQNIVLFALTEHILNFPSLCLHYGTLPALCWQFGLILSQLCQIYKDKKQQILNIIFSVIFLVFPPLPP